MSHAILKSSALYNSQDDRWLANLDMPTARAAFGIVSGRDGWIYAIGGVAAPPTGVCAINEAVNLTTREWRSLRPMPTPRQFLALALGGDGLIYAIGGCDASQRALDSVEAYDPATDSWTSRQPLPAPRGFLGAATGDDGIVYAVGGQDLPAVASVSGDLTAFDTGTGHWTARQPMPTARFGLAFAAGRNGKLYAAGGRDLITDVKRTEEYDPATNVWRVRADMLAARAQFGMAADYFGRFYAVGGDDPQGLIVEQFTP